jgi:hypothetical protein
LDEDGFFGEEGNGEMDGEEMEQIDGQGEEEEYGDEEEEEGDQRPSKIGKIQNKIWILIFNSANFAFQSKKTSGNISSANMQQSSRWENKIQIIPNNCFF